MGGRKRGMMQKAKKINKIGQMANNCINYDCTLKSCFYYENNNQVIKPCPVLNGDICTNFIGKVVK